MSRRLDSTLKVVDSQNVIQNLKTKPYGPLKSCGGGGGGGAIGLPQPNNKDPMTII